MINNAEWKDRGPRAGFCVPGLGFAAFLLIFTISCLLSGCGSDSKPAAVAGGEKHQAKATAKPRKPVVPSALVVELGSPGSPGKMGQIKKTPDSRGQVIFGGMSPQELEAKAADSLAQMHKAQKERRSVVLGGMTQEELEARAAESLRMLKSKPGGEIFPGITQQELETMARQKPNPGSTLETFPGATQDQVDASHTGNLPKPDFQENFPPGGKTGSTPNLPPKVTKGTGASE
jgi:hypothetical protein